MTEKEKLLNKIRKLRNEIKQIDGLNEQKNSYRFVYIESHNTVHYNSYLGKLTHTKGEMIFQHDSFYLPNGMSCQEAFQVLSYLVETIEKEQNLPKCSNEALCIANELLGDYGFVKIEGTENSIPLYTLSYDSELAKDIAYSAAPDYFEWFVPSVTQKQVQEIYNNSLKAKSSRNILYFKLKQ